MHNMYMYMYICNYSFEERGTDAPGGRSTEHMQLYRDGVLTNRYIPTYEYRTTLGSLSL